MEVEARPKHEFTEKVAGVFCRWIERFYSKAKRAFDEGETCYDDDYDSLYSFYYPSKPFYVQIEWDVDLGESEMSLGFGPDTVIDRIDHLFCRERTMESLHEWVKNSIGIVRSFCSCGEVITTDDRACDYCYIFWYKREGEPCVVCHEDEGRWVRLECDCRGGRVIHQACWIKICATAQHRCPCCRKSDLEVVNDPHFD